MPSFFMSVLHESPNCSQKSEVRETTAPQLGYIVRLKGRGWTDEIPGYSDLICEHCESNIKKRFDSE